MTEPDEESDIRTMARSLRKLETDMISLEFFMDGERFVVLVARTEAAIKTLRYAKDHFETDTEEEVS